MSKNTFTQNLYIAAIALVVIVCPAVKLFGGNGIAFSEGQRTGKVYKISNKGILWKTWEGQLSLQLVTADGNGRMVNEVFDFSCSDPAVVDQIKAAAMSGEQVTLSYIQYLFRSWREGSTGYDVVRVDRGESPLSQLSTVTSQ